MRLNHSKLRFFLCAVALFGLCVYSAMVGPGRKTLLQNVQRNAEAFDGREIRLNSKVIVSRLLADGFEIEQSGAKIFVKIPEHQLHEWQVAKDDIGIGDYVSLRANFQREGYLSLIEMHVHSWRGAKIWVSSVALLLLAGFLMWGQRIFPLNYA